MNVPGECANYPELGWADANAPAVYYEDCAAVRAAGRDPLWRHEPGYRLQLDRDQDGRGCDPAGFGGWINVITRDIGRLASGD